MIPETLRYKRVYLDIGEKEDELRVYYVVRIRRLLRKYGVSLTANIRIREAIVAFLRDEHSIRWLDIAWMLEMTDANIQRNYNEYHTRKMNNPNAYADYVSVIHELYRKINKIFED